MKSALMVIMVGCCVDPADEQMQQQKRLLEMNALQAGAPINQLQVRGSPYAVTQQIANVIHLQKRIWLSS